MKTVSLVAATVLALTVFASCNQNEPKPKEEINQPSNPYTWSPVGKTYIFETTWDGSPSPGHYWVWVIKFYSQREVVEYETPNKDLSYHEDYLHTIDSTYYSVHYPTIEYHSPAGGISPMIFIDTTTIQWDANNVTYTLLN